MLANRSAFKPFNQLFLIIISGAIKPFQVFAVYVRAAKLMIGTACPPHLTKRDKKNLQTQTSQHIDERILSLLSGKATSEQGFRLLMQTYQERLYWQIRRMVHEHEDANDVLQNCFVKVYRSIHQFEGKSKLYTWLYRIATNEAITFLNKQKQKATATIDSEENNLSNQLKADPYFDGGEIQILLKNAIDRLPEKQQQVFNLRYYDEMSYAEMSELLSTSQGALKASFHHAVKKIEQYVKKAANGF